MSLTLMPRVKVTVDRAKCVACGIAQSECPEVFVLGDDNGKNRVVDKYGAELTGELSVGYIPLELLDCVKRSAELCPVEAITFEVVE